MNRKFLIIGNPTISNSFIQVMNILTTYQFEQIEVSDFYSLEDYRDDIQGIILMPPDEVELAKHFRLTETLGNLRLLPLIIITPRMLEHHLREKRDNIFLLSPNCFVISASNCITGLLGSMEKLKPFESLGKMIEEIRPFITWSQEDDIVSSHDNFNRFGPFKLMKEHFGTLPEHLSMEHKDISSRLWFKKYKFLEPLNGRIEVLTVDEGPFRNAVCNKKVLYIDDEHRLGWSFALNSLFTGNSNREHYQLFQGIAPFISTIDGRFACVDSVNEALKMTDAWNKSLESALSHYSDAEHLRNGLSEEFAEVRKNAREIEEKTKNAEINIKRTETALRETETGVKKLQEQLRSAMDIFADAYLKGTAEVAVSDIAPEVKGISEGYTQYEMGVNVLIKYRDENKRNIEIFERCKAELERQRRLLNETESKNIAAIRRYDEAVKALSSERLFPYDLVILDLRLERLLDKDRAPHEMSGVRVLKRIKELDPSIPVLMFTASEKAMNYQQAIDLGASGYWIKAVNSLSALKSETIKSLEKAHEARSLWQGIRKVAAKKQLSYTRENQSTFRLERMIMEDSRKSEIIMLLKESFLLFMMERSPYEKAVCNYSNYGKIALNMGIIQEERFDRIQDKRWDFWVNQKAKEIDHDEIIIRKLRNKAAHKAGSKISYQEALEVFQKTVERCLSR